METAVCQGCRAVGWENFQEFYDQYYTCMQCGLSCIEPEKEIITEGDYTGIEWDILDENFWPQFQAQPEHRRTYEQVLEEQQRLYSAKFRGSYNRRAHINERMYAHCLREPLICRHDSDIIQTKLEHHMFNNTGYTLSNATMPTKRDIQHVLRSIDKQNLHPQTKWCKKYLERWKSIAEVFMNPQHVDYPERPTVQITYTPQELSMVGQLFIAFSNVWDRWQPPRMKYNRSTWKFPDRKHFPNFNYIFCKIHDLIGCSEHNVYFPVPHSADRKLSVFFDSMCKELGIPLAKSPVQTTLGGPVTNIHRKRGIKPFTDDLQRARKQMKINDYI